jgi:uncharacterized membrane protein YeaQ/YmgE (transglycosylase-associated protein family)
MMIEFLVLLLIAGICGSIAQRLVGGTRGGCLASIALGFIGALIGMWIASEAGLPQFIEVEIGGKSFPIIWSIIGASLFASILAFFGGRKRVD